MESRQRLPLVEAKFSIVKEGDEESRFLPYIYWVFGEMPSGDCRIYAGATLKYFSDGSLTWVADISSSDSGDEWEMALAPTRAPNVTMFDIYPRFDIRDKDVVKHWELAIPPNPNFAQFFSQADGGIMGWYSC